MVDQAKGQYQKTEIQEHYNSMRRVLKTRAGL